MLGDLYDHHHIYMWKNKAWVCILKGYMYIEALCTQRWIDSTPLPSNGRWQNLMIISNYIFVILFTNRSARAGYDTRSLFKRSLTGLNSEFSSSLTSCLTKAEEPSLSYYLSIAGGRIIEFIPFPRVLVLCEMQSLSSRIWTRVAVSISDDDNHYTTGASTHIFVIRVSQKFKNILLIWGTIRLLRKLLQSS